MKKIYIKENKLQLLKEEKDVFNWGNYFSNLKRIDESIRNKVKK